MTYYHEKTSEWEASAGLVTWLTLTALLIVVLVLGSAVQCYRISSLEKRTTAGEEFAGRDSARLHSLRTLTGDYYATLTAGHLMQRDSIRALGTRVDGALGDASRRLTALEVWRTHTQCPDYFTVTNFSITCQTLATEEP